MQHHIQTLVKHLFRKDSLQEVGLHQLQQFTEEYPYAAAAQLLLAKKMHDTGSTAFAEQGEKLSLYSNDPVWTAWLLSHGTGGAEVNYDHLFAKEETTAEQPGFSFASVELHQEPVASEVPPPFETATAEDPAAIQETVATHSAEEPPVAAKTETTGTEAAMENTRDATPVAEQSAPPSASEANATTPGDGDIPFEPYHTIDYFASVGIKLKPEDLTKDKLGKQLKSFTEWLRTMKRIGPNPDASVIKELDEATSQSIQRIAENSNEANEIITEAMAEVWAKQGHTGRAIAIYEKLSLLNPAKSHYFAGKIEALKAL